MAMAVALAATTPTTTATASAIIMAADAGAAAPVAATREARLRAPSTTAAATATAADMATIMAADITAAEVTDFQALPGNGLSARQDGTLLCGGNLSFISGQAAVPQEVQAKAEDLAGQGKTPLFFSRDGKLLGVIAVADVIKEDSPQAVRELKNMGIHVVMLTGDNEKTARAIGAQAGVDEVIAGVLPDGKETVIRRLQERGVTAMVGDGINDAPALTRADIGIAIGAGTDIAIDAADIVLMKSRLRDVPAAVRLSRATLKNIHENLFWAFFYNVIGIPLAAGLWYPVFGWKLNPMFGAAAMSLSSFCVVSNALRLNFFKMYDAAKDKMHKRRAELKIHEEGLRVERKEDREENHTKESCKIENCKEESYKKENNKTEKENVIMEKTMEIKGMMCGHCEAAVKKALEALPEVARADVSHEKGTAVVTLQAEVADDVLKKAVEEKDYEVVSVR